MYVCQINSLIFIMEKFETINDIFDFAIENEQKAVVFYNDLAKNAKNESMRESFERFAREEMGHKARLQKVKAEGYEGLKQEKILDLKISDYLVKTEPYPDMPYEEALILAMNQEKASFKLYSTLAVIADNGEMRELFLSLSQEESKHKLSFEIEYDEFVLREN